jgi:hypothetical protein
MVRTVGKVVGADARTVVSMPGHISMRNMQIWMKTWHKALVDENKDSEDINNNANDNDDADQHLDVGVTRQCSTLLPLEALASLCL